MTPTLEALVQALLDEGFALRPYTPGVVAGATPAPFGVLYPPAYAASVPGLHDRVELSPVARHPPAAPVGVRATAVFLTARSVRGEASEGRIDLAWHALSALKAATIAVPFAGGALRAYLEVSAAPLGHGLSRIDVCVCNTTELDCDHTPRPTPGGARRAALRRSLLSTQVVVELDGATFVSPMRREGELGQLVAGCRNVNTWPVLASPRDDVVLGASVFLPDHPRLPGPRGPAATELAALADTSPPAPRAADGHPPEPEPATGAAVGPGPAAPIDGAALGEMPGESAVVVDGATFHRGGKVRLCPQRDDPFDRILDGRHATVERIFLDFDDRVYFGVTVDDDPARDLFRETGRLLFFFADEVEVISP